MPRDRGYSDYGRASRDQYYAAATKDQYDPEFDARNYRSHPSQAASQSLSHRSSREHRSERDAVSSRSEREYRQAEIELVQPAERNDYYEYAEKKPKKKSKHKRKHSKDRSQREKKKPKQKALVDYDDISSESEVYQESIVSEHLVQHSPIRSRVSPEVERRHRERASSPGSAIREYNKSKHLYDNHHYDSPAAYRDPSPTYIEQTRSSKSSKSSRRALSPEMVVTKSKSHRSERADAPKAYADPPKAYKPRTESPSPKRARHRSRTPSPYQVQRRRSPSPQYSSSR